MPLSVIVTILVTAALQACAEQEGAQAERVTVAPENEVRTLVQRILDGEDVSGVFFAYLHDDKSPLPLISAASRELLSQLNALEPTRRARAESFLCGDSLHIPLDACTPHGIRKRLDVLDAEIVKQQSRKQ